MTRLILSGYYGYDNLGDEAILQAMIMGLQQKIKGVELVVLSANPRVTEKRYGVEAVHRYDLKSIIGEIKKADLFISGGGSLLQDVTGKKSIPFYLGLVFLAQLMGKKTVFYAQGIGPITGKAGKFLVKWVGNRTDLITVRDYNSKELLKKIGVKPELIQQTVDPVFWFKDRTKVNPFFAKNRQKKIIGIAVRPWLDNNYIPIISQTVNKLANKINGEVVILPMHYYKDRGISKNLKTLLKVPSKIIEEKLTPLQMLSYFANFDIFIGVRLHALIFAALQKVPFVAISYDPKVDSFLNMLEINTGLKIEDLSGNVLQDIAETVWYNRDQFQGLLEEKTTDFKRVADLNLDMVLEIIKGDGRNG